MKILFEKGGYSIRQIRDAHLEVYRDGVTYATRCATIHFKTFRESYTRAVQEVERRILADLPKT